MGITNSTVAISRTRFRAPGCGTPELVGAFPNASSGQCSTCCALAEKLAERETKLAKSEAERNQAAAERDQAVMERDEAVAERDQVAAKLAERDAGKLSLEQRARELERSASKNSFNSGKPHSSDG